MEDFSQWLGSAGNAALVPVVIGLTQALKRAHILVNDNPNVMALSLSFVLSVGYNYYKLPDDVVFESFRQVFRFVVDGGVIGFATFLAASKIYDFTIKSKKDEAKTEELKGHIEDLKKKIEINEQPTPTLKGILEDEN